jgi:hypothetical protein
MGWGWIFFEDIENLISPFYMIADGKIFWADFWGRKENKKFMLASLKSFNNFTKFQ